MKFTLTCAALLLGLAMMPVARAAEAKADKDGWYQLFNGKNLDGWKISEDNPETFKVVDGEIVAHGEAAHLFYDGPVENHNFKDFEYECEVLTKPKANSGMYFHTKYQPKSWPTNGIEVQVNQTHGDPKKTGSLYNIKNIMDKSPAKDDEWFTQNITVKGNHVTVKVNGKVVNEWTQPEDYKREDGWETAKIGSGTFALQGHDPDSETHYRSVKVKPLK
ncbi:MAG: DUF1080 domain-containing protein [Pirellula sp.]|nr:DUF1080 domain-containing protein [Pirellula sp.]